MSEAPEFFTIAKPRARVAHRCCECGGTIRAGERYERFSGAWDGKMATFKTCVECAHLRELIYAVEAPEEVIFCELGMWLSESEICTPQQKVYFADCAALRGGCLLGPDELEDLRVSGETARANARLIAAAPPVPT